MPNLPRILATLSACVVFSIAAAQSENDENLYLIEIEGFQVFSNSMKIIDGFTGKEYVGKHPVVLGFRREFDTILTKYHQKLLLEEAKNLKTRADMIKPFESDLSELASRFGIDGFSIPRPILSREISIFKRMVKDPFFNIEELVVWDLGRLEGQVAELPDSKYSKNVRLNKETGKWERRVTTKWEVSWITPDRHRRQIYKYKEQGLNLDTHKGYHIPAGLRPDVPTEAFQDVKLQYPIFYNTGEATDIQIKTLAENFLLNLIYIYDPYSWVVRGNTRFRGGFSGQLYQYIQKQSLPVQNREWIDRLLANLINDIVTIKYWGVDEIYDLQMLSTDTKNSNQLGIDLDLLNWHPNEKRSLDYDPSTPHRVPEISFENPSRARFILLDAYRRYGNSFIDALVLRFNSIEGRADPQRLVRDVIEEVSGVSADKYIPAAIKIQKAELKRFLRP